MATSNLSRGQRSQIHLPHWSGFSARTWITLTVLDLLQHYPSLAALKNEGMTLFGIV